MEEDLIKRLESADSRLEAISIGSRPLISIDNNDEGPDPAIVAYDDLRMQFVGRVRDAAVKIGGQGRVGRYRYFRRGVFCSERASYISKFEFGFDYYINKQMKRRKLGYRERNWKSVEQCVVCCSR